MKYAAINDRLANLGGAKWAIHRQARARVTKGEDIVELCIGEPDVPVADDMIEEAVRSMRAGRYTYSNGRGEPGLTAALAERYSRTSGRNITPDQMICLPGTQTALYLALLGLAQEGDEVLVGDPYYATYEGVIRSSGADLVKVPLLAENGFRLQASDIEARITPRSRVILLNTPHNPTGAILTAEDIAAIGEVARAHDLWIISDEVYEDLVFDDATFCSPLSLPELAERVVVVSSISKSHAAPGFRSGWCVGSPEFVETLLPLAETMLFGGQSFIADMTELGIRQGSSVAEGMRNRYASRARTLASRLADETALWAHPPQAGMFIMVNIAATGIPSDVFAQRLLDEAGLAVMPGSSFGDTVRDWIRIALTVEDERFYEGVERLIAFARQFETVSA